MKAPSRTRADLPPALWTCHNSEATFVSFLSFFPLTWPDLTWRHECLRCALLSYVAATNFHRLNNNLHSFLLRGRLLRPSSDPRRELRWGRADKMRPGSCHCHRPQLATLAAVQRMIRVTTSTSSETGSDSAVRSVLYSFILYLPRN